MAPRWERSTVRLSGIDQAPPDTIAAVEKTALGLGIEWDPSTVTLVWATTATAQGGKLLRRTKTVRTVGFLSDAVLAWTIDQDGEGPHALVVRRSRVDIADGVTALAGLSPEMQAKFTSAETDGVTVRGDLGGRDIANAFIGLGSGPDADAVRATLLGR